MSHAGMLACPQCGAAVPEASAACAYCHAPLLLKACPSCLTRVFAGHTYCPACGVALADTPQARHARSCPRCAAALVARMIEDVILDDCNGCGGTFVDRAALVLLLDARRASRAESVLGAYDPGGDAPLPMPAGAFYVKCPDCAVVMNRRQFAHGAKVIIDVCKTHGTWFDAHELPRIVRFVREGGLAQAEKWELEQQRERLAEERRKLKAESLEGNQPQPQASHGGLFASLLRGLL